MLNFKDLLTSLFQSAVYDALKGSVTSGAPKGLFFCLKINVI
ncbi:hypothetical protein [Enterococcus sp. AZ102]